MGRRTHLQSTYLRRDEFQNIQANHTIQSWRPNNWWKIGKWLEQTFLQRRYANGQHVCEPCCTSLVISKSKLQWDITSHLSEWLLKTPNSKSWWGDGEEGTRCSCLGAWQGVRPLWETVWRFPTPSCENAVWCFKTKAWALRGGLAAWEECRLKPLFATFHVVLGQHMDSTISPLSYREGSRRRRPWQQVPSSRWPSNRKPCFLLSSSEVTCTVLSSACEPHPRTPHTAAHVGPRCPGTAEEVGDADGGKNWAWRRKLLSPSPSWHHSSQTKCRRLGVPCSCAEPVPAAAASWSPAYLPSWTLHPVGYWSAS